MRALVVEQAKKENISISFPRNGPVNGFCKTDGVTDYSILPWRPIFKLTFDRKTGHCSSVDKICPISLKESSIPHIN